LALSREIRAQSSKPRLIKNSGAPSTPALPFVALARSSRRLHSATFTEAHEKCIAIGTIGCEVRRVDAFQSFVDVAGDDFGVDWIEPLVRIARDGQAVPPVKIALAVSNSG